MKITIDLLIPAVQLQKSDYFYLYLTCRQWNTVRFHENYSCASNWTVASTHGILHQATSHISLWETARRIRWDRAYITWTFIWLCKRSSQKTILLILKFSFQLFLLVTVYSRRNKIYYIYLRENNSVVFSGSSLFSLFSVYGILKEDIWVTTIIKAHFTWSRHSPETKPDVGTAMCDEKISS